MIQRIYKKNSTIKNKKIINAKNTFIQKNTFKKIKAIQKIVNLTLYKILKYKNKYFIYNKKKII